jgi:site-specific recombinase XerD
MKTREFIEHLKTKGLTSRTITSFDRVAMIFLNWSAKEQINVEEVSYQDILSFMKYCQKQGVSQRTVQLYLNVQSGKGNQSAGSKTKSIVSHLPARRASRNL